jgi:hypothetical protein
MGYPMPGGGAISNSTLPMCQGRSVHGISDAQSQWRLSWEADRPKSPKESRLIRSPRSSSSIETLSKPVRVRQSFPSSSPVKCGISAGIL